MSRVLAEPIHPASHHPAVANSGNHAFAGAPGGNILPSQPNEVRPADVEALVARVQGEFPNAHIRITGRGRTVERQAELMAQRRRQNRAQFLETYRPARHITEMDNWVTAHPNARDGEATAAFVEIIDRARQNGAVVSNHLSDHARDVSIPIGDPATRDRIRQRMQNLGAHVIDEHDAVGGPHWHVDF